MVDEKTGLEKQKTDIDEWKSTAINENGIIGSWVTKNDVTIAAFVQYGIPACTIYQDNKSKVFLTLRDNKIVIQYEDEQGVIHILDANSFEKLIKIANILQQGI